ncbi:MAG TPA: ABC transporter substrate-binding protein, partial [Acidimicrobiales bacterium]|nr:ABC transporter substrate-binding protein [Acidimicrobiales bacterium]
MYRHALPVAAAAAIAVAGTLVLGAESGATSPSRHQPEVSYASGGTFSMVISSDPGDIDPYQSTEGTARQIYAFGYDTLLARSPKGKPVADLARSWSASPQQVRYTLKPGVTCDDGATLTASDVAQDFDYIKNPKTISPWLSFVLPIGYSVSADDATRTVTIKTVKPFGLLLQAAGELPIVCPQGLTDANSIQHKFDGTGPFQITSYS